MTVTWRVTELEEIELTLAVALLDDAEDVGLELSDPNAPPPPVPPTPEVAALDDDAS